MSIPKLATVATLGLALAACSTGGGPKEDIGTLAGAIGGGVIGSQIGGGTKERVAGAAVGALLGGLIGNRIGAALDEEDKRRAYAAQVDALERSPSGAPVAWKNPDSGHYGSIVPGPSYQQAGRPCRSYTHTIYIGGRPETARGTACRNPDGTWTPVT